MLSSVRLSDPSIKRIIFVNISKKALIYGKVFFYKSVYRGALYVSLRCPRVFLVKSKYFCPEVNALTCTHST